MSRIRSRGVETETVNPRLLGRGAVTTEKVPSRAITEDKRWPGSARVREAQLTPGLVQSLDGRFTNGETVTLTTAGVTETGQVTWDSVVRGEGYEVELPDPIARRYGYRDFHVTVKSKLVDPEGDEDGPRVPIRGLTITANGSESVTVGPTPFCTVWSGCIPQVIANPGDPLTIDLDWTGSADVDVELTVGIVEPVAVQAEVVPDGWFCDGQTVDEFPVGWTQRWDIDGSWRIESSELSLSPCGQLAVWDGEFDNSRRLLSIDNAGTPTDVDVTARIGAESTGDYPVGVTVRGSGTQASPEGYALWLGASGAVLAKWVDGSPGNEIVPLDSDATFVASSLDWVRLRIQGSTVQGKAWADGDPEPATWSVEATDSDYSTGGWVGVSHLSQSSDTDPVLIDRLTFELL